MEMGPYTSVVEKHTNREMGIDLAFKKDSRFIVPVV
jgi:hypothetical protein